MYKCYDCGGLFDESKTEHDKVQYGEEYVDGPGYEVCPFCGGNFEEAKRCAECGEYFIDGNYKEFCDDCAKEIKQRFLSVLHNEFTPDEVNLLNELFDGECFE